MKPRTTKAARTLPFAHFFGLKSRAEEQNDDLDEDREQREGESDEDYARRMEELDDQQENPDGDESDLDAEDQEGDGDKDGEDDQTPDAGDADEEDNDDDEKKPAAARRAARREERFRCAAIVAHGMKMGRTHLACSFAFDSNLSVSQAKAALNAAAQDAPVKRGTVSNLRQRMSSVKTGNPGANGGGESDSGPRSLADRIVAVGDRVRRK